MSEGIDTPPAPPATAPAAGDNAPATTSSAMAEKKPRKRFVGTSARGAARAGVRRVANQVPDDILNDPALKAAMAGTLILALLSAAKLV